VHILKKWSLCFYAYDEMLHKNSYPDEHSAEEVQENVQTLKTGLGLRKQYL